MNEADEPLIVDDSDPHDHDGINCPQCAITCTAEYWYAHGDAILAAQPVRELSLHIADYYELDRFISSASWQSLSKISLSIPRRLIESDRPRTRPRPGEPLGWDTFEEWADQYKQAIRAQWLGQQRPPEFTFVPAPPTHPTTLFVHPGRSSSAVFHVPPQLPVEDWHAG